MKSTVTDYETICFFCGGQSECYHHLLNGRGIRDKAEIDGIKVPSCNKHHNMGPLLERIHGNPMAEKLSKMLGQAIWERNYCAEGHTLAEARAAFMRRYYKNYL